MLKIRQKTKIRNGFNNNLLINIKLRKTQISRRIQSRRFLGALLGKIDGPITKTAFPFSKSIMLPLGLTAKASPENGGNHKRVYRRGITLVISNEEMNDITRIMNTLEDSVIFINGISETKRANT